MLRQPTYANMMWDGSALVDGGVLVDGYRLRRTMKVLAREQRAAAPDYVQVQYTWEVRPPGIWSHLKFFSHSSKPVWLGKCLDSEEVAAAFGCGCGRHAYNNLVEQKDEGGFRSCAFGETRGGWCIVAALPCGTNIRTDSMPDDVCCALTVDIEDVNITITSSQKRE
jgi:hypothetical protein